MLPRPYGISWLLLLHSLETHMSSPDTYVMFVWGKYNFLSLSLIISTKKCFPCCNVLNLRLQGRITWISWIKLHWGILLGVTDPYGRIFTFSVTYMLKHSFVSNISTVRNCMVKDRMVTVSYGLSIICSNFIFNVTLCLSMYYEYFIGYPGVTNEQIKKK